jgi:hypothetical protein
MQTFMPFLSGRCPPEHLASFAWIVEVAVAGTNYMRGDDAFHITPANLFRPPVCREAKSPRLLAAFLARKLLGWPNRILNAVFYPHSLPADYTNRLAVSASTWVAEGCQDDTSFLSLSPILDFILRRFPSVQIPNPQILSAHAAPELVLARPPPRPLRPRSRAEASSSLARPITIDHVITTVAHHFGLTRDELLSSSRSASLTHPRHVGMYLAKQLTGRGLPFIARRFNRRNHTTVLHAVRKIARMAANDNRLADELESLVRDINVFSRTGKLPFRNAAAVVADPASLDGSIADTPFVQRLHWRLAKAARTMGDTPQQFIAELIADAADAGSKLSLKPEPFREVLVHRGEDLPAHLLPYGELIQEKLFLFAAVRSKIAAPELRASVFQSVRAGD